MIKRTAVNLAFKFISRVEGCFFTVSKVMPLMGSSRCLATLGKGHLPSNDIDPVFLLTKSRRNVT